MSATEPRVLIFSAADSRFMPLLRGMLASIEPFLAQDNVEFACFDTGLAAADWDWLAQQSCDIMVPETHFGLSAEAHSPSLRSFLARPFLPDYRPGFDVYVWIDSDVWLQDPAVLARYVAGATRTGMAVTHERERAYRFQPWLLGWTAKHFLKGYGVRDGLALLTHRHLNAGFFAGRAGAPHWAAWARRYEAAIRRSGALVPHDQFALVQAVHTGAGRQASRFATAILPPENNWICDRGPPMWNDAVGAFCKPYRPFEPLGALHLAGPAKAKPYAIQRTGGGSFTSFVIHGASPAKPATIGPLAPLPARPATTVGEPVLALDVP